MESSRFSPHSFDAENGEDDAESALKIVTELQSEVRKLKTKSKAEITAWIRTDILILIMAVVMTVAAGVGWERFAREKEEHRKTRAQVPRRVEDMLRNILIDLRRSLEKNIDDHPTDIPTEEDHPAATSEPDHQ